MGARIRFRRHAFGGLVGTMQLPVFYTDDRNFSQMQTRWASILNPMLEKPINSSNILKNVTLASGSNVINHLQGQPLNGYIIIGMHGAYAQIYDTPSSSPSKTLVLNASAPTTIDLLVF